MDIPVIDSLWRLNFSAYVQTDFGAHPASCKIVIGSVVKRDRAWL